MTGDCVGSGENDGKCSNGIFLVNSRYDSYDVHAHDGDEVVALFVVVMVKAEVMVVIALLMKGVMLTVSVT